MTRSALVLVLSVLSWALPTHAVQRSLLNPSFETPALTGTCVAFVNQSLSGGWRTTETNTANTGACGVPTGGTGGVLEYWSNGFNGVPADSGANHIELNAYNPARVSQSLCLVAGDRASWQFSHRARDVGLGAWSRDVALFSVDSSSNRVRTANTSAAGATGGSCPTSSGGVTGNSCAASTVGGWGRYSGSFTWAGSSGTHDIGFEAVSNSTNNPGAGNFLDNVQFTLKPMVEFDSVSASTYVVAESAGTVTFKLRVAGIVPAGGVQVPFTVSGTATSGSDYTALATSNFTIPAGDYGAGTVVNASQMLAVLDDMVVEDTETVIVTLGASTPASPYVLSSTSTCGGAAVATAAVSILDNDVNVTLTKAIVGTPSDGGRFNLQITGGTPSGGTNPANDVGHDGTTGVVRVATGATVTLAETAGTGTLLTNYIPTLACTDGNGAAVTVSGSGTSRTIPTPVTGITAATASTAAARTLSCTYTNTMRPKVTVQKMSVGGTGTFNFSLTGVTVGTDTVTTAASGTAVASTVVHLGTGGTAATVTEAAASAVGYITTARCVDAGSAISGNTTPITGTGTAITIPAANMKGGADYTCTFTNTGTSILTLGKTAPATVAPGATIAYGLSLANTGAAATGTTVAVREQLPPGVTAESVTSGTGVTAVACGTLPSAAGAALTCTMTITGGIPALTGVRGFTLNAKAPTAPALAAVGTVLTNHANTRVDGAGTATTAPGAACVSDATVSCASASTTMATGAGAVAQSGVRTVIDNQLADGSAQDVLEAFIRDAAQNPVAGAVVSFGATPDVAFNGGAVGAAGTCTTTATGTCQVTATSAVAAVYGATPVTVGGAALAGTFSAGGNNYLPSPQPYRFGAMPTVTIRKVSLNAIGTFDFTGTNGVGAQSITTLVAGTPTAGVTRTLTAPNTAMTLTEAVPPAGFSLTAASCTGMGAGGTATLSGRVLSLNAAATAPGSNLVCTFINTGSTIVPPPIPPTIMCTTNAAVFNTGYGPNGPLTSGRDTVWESGEGTPMGGPASVTNWQRAYVGNQAPGAWINSPFGNANWNSNYTIAGHAPNDVDVYHRFTFNLASSVTPTSFALKLDFYSDNSVAEVFVNGVLQTVPGVPQNPGNPYYHGGFVAGAAASATLASNWRTGSNTVVVHIKSGPNAEGFLAQTTTTAVCAPPTVTLSKTTTGSAGGPFNFSLTNTAQASGTATTVAAGTPVQVDGSAATAGLQAFTATAVGTAVTIAEAAVPGWNLASASCTDAGTPVGSLGTGAAARTYTIPAASVQYGKALQCLFTNSASATVTVRKVSVGNVGTFGFTGDNGLAAQSIVTATAGTAVAAGIQTLAAPATVTTLTEDPLPANYALTAVACTGLGAGGSATPDLPNRRVVLDAAATAAGSNIVCTFTNTYTPPYPKVQIVKTTVGGSGSHVFGFALSGLSAPTETITVVGAGTASGSATLVGTAGLEATITETVPTGWPANPVSASCVDSASATTTAFGTLVANQLTIPAANMVAGANIICTFTNSFGFSVGGRVFNDNGVGAGTANDGLLNGGEAGIAGVTVRLTNCAATVLASAVTDGAGRYTLAVPFVTAAAAPLCVEETNPATPSAWTSTGASVGGTALPSGSATTAAGTAYTYTRTGTPDRIAFTWNGVGPASLDFGDVAPNTLAADGAKTGLPGSTVSYPHTFKAQTGGSVRFGISGEVATPTLPGWSGKIFADTGCTGALQAGAVLLYPPSVPVTVVAGQSVCLVMEEFVPATAMNGYSNDATVQASFDFSNAGPALGASYTVHDITTVSDSVLDLRKEVRNVTQGDAFGINNQAKSGETLEYRITYTNNGVSPIGTLSVNDTTPSYTRFVNAQTGSTPATLTACQKTTPANPAPAPTVACATAQAVGGIGALSWHFTGVLSPGDSGAVLFSVKVD